MWLEEVLTASPVFGSLPPPVQRSIAASANMHHMPARTLLSAAEEPLAALYLVRSGQIELTAVSADGEEVTLTALGSGAWATWLGVMDPTPAGHGFWASRGSVVLSFPAALIRSTLLAHPTVMPAVVHQIGDRFRNLMKWVEQSALAQRDQRLAQLLLLLAQQGSSDDTIMLTRDRIASLLGCSRQTLHDALTRMAAAGLIQLGYGRVIILDSGALRQFAGGARGRLSPALEIRAISS